MMTCHASRREEDSPHANKADKASPGSEGTAAKTKEAATKKSGKQSSKVFLFYEQ